MSDSRLPSAHAHIVTQTALALVVVLAFVLRMYGLRNETPWYDEVLTQQLLHAPSLSQSQYEVHRQAHLMPGYFVLAYLWQACAGGSIFGLRLLSVIAGVATVPLLFGLVRLSYGPLAGLVSAGLLAVSKTHIYYSQEMRTYSWTILFIVFSAFLLCLAVQDGKRGYWIAHCAVNALLPWFHLLGLCIVVAEGAYLVVCRVPRRILLNWVIVQAVFVSAAVPWYVTLDRETIRQGGAWLRDKNLVELVRIVVLTLTGASPYDAYRLPAFLAGVSFAKIAGGLVLLLAMIPLLRFFRAGAWRDGNRVAATLMFAVWAASLPIGLYALSFVSGPALSGRYTVFSIPAICALAGIGVSLASAKSLRIGAVTAIVTLFVLLHVGWERPLRPNWRELSARLGESIVPGDKVIVNEYNFARWMLEHYAPIMPRDVAVCADRDRMVKLAAESVSSAHTVWVVWASDEFLSSGGSEAIANALRERGCTFTRAKFGRRDSLDLYRLPGVRDRNDGK